VTVPRQRLRRAATAPALLRNRKVPRTLTWWPP